MGIITGTSTIADATTSILSLQASDLGYVVILLIIIAGLLAIDLVRRLFSRR